MSVDEVSDQLADLNLKEISEEQLQQVFEKVKGLSCVKDVAVISPEGVAFHSTLDLPVEEVKVISGLFASHKHALQQAIPIKGVRHEVHRYFPEEGLIYGRYGQGGKDSIGAALIRNFSNALVLVTYGFPNLSARVIPIVRKELEKF